MEINILYIFDIIGTIAFAVSGVIPAIRKKMDLFGILIIAFVTAIGGGTLRDLLIGVPVAWLQDMTYVYVITITVILAIIFRNRLIYMCESLSFFDAIGLSAFTLIGLEKALLVGYSVPICIAIGVMTACFGGVIRDTLADKVPIVFRKEIYATASIAGGIVYFAIQGVFSNVVIAIISGSVVFLVRIITRHFNLKLPKYHLKYGNN